jgi:hypothetical protein
MAFAGPDAGARQEIPAMSFCILARRLFAASLAGSLVLASTSLAAAHETRVIDDEYRLTVGMIAEPVFVGQKSGLELRVVTQAEDAADQVPVDGLVDTLQAEVAKGDLTRDVEISARFGSPGWYQSYFFPTEAGPYAFRVYGTINGVPVDETYTAGAPGDGASGQFGAVEEVAAGQFPSTLPSDAEIALQAEAGQGAADQLPIALGLGGAGLVLGIIAIALALAGRRRTA